jgi:hypothetical protein
MTQSTNSHDAMVLLGAGIPLSLLVDLMTLDVSRSREIAVVERADTAWIHAAA